jgi:TM2 domain-containing membrane protein YozV
MNDAAGAGQGGPPQGGWPPPPGPAVYPGGQSGGGPQFAPPGYGPAGPAMTPPGWQPPPQLPPGADWDFRNRKIPAGICGILFGSLGVHKFVLGYIKEGVIMALLTIVSFISFFVSMFIPAIAGASDSDTAAGASVVAIFAIWGIAWLVIMAMYIIGLIEGIMYLTKSDYDFVMRYNVQHHGWF